MTAIAAFTGEAAAVNGCVGRMLDAAPHRGSHVSVWEGDRVALGIRAPSPRGGARAPSIDTIGEHAIAFAGRLDNASELRARLDAGAGATDGTIALLAFSRWRDDALVQLIGDFAFALWDARRGCLVCARDGLGQRPLFHAAIAQGTIVASEPQQLLAHPGCPRAIDEGVVAEFLSGRPATVEDTVWRGVSRLRPGARLDADGRQVRRRCYWAFDSARQLDCRTDAEYDDQFRSLFEEAIACRTRDQAAVGVFLSGGIDSSAIAGVMAKQQARGGPPAVAFSLTFPGQPPDESAYIDAVAERWGLRSVRMAARVPDRAALEAEIDAYLDLPAYPNGTILDPLRRRAAQEVTVVLTGYGGDDWFTGSPRHTADLLRAGRWLAAARQLRADAALPGRGYGLAGLARASVAPLLPAPVRRALRPVTGGARPVFPWIRPELAARVDLDDRLHRPRPAGGGTFVQRDMRAIADNLDQIRADELEERAAVAAGIEQRHPFSDRRLAEFGFALPEAQRWVGRETKVVIRRALRDTLPTAVAARDDKAEFTSTLVDTLEGLGGAAFFRRLRIADAGWVDPAGVIRMYQEMRGLYSRGGESYIQLADAVWSVAAVELWFIRASKERSL